MSNYTTPHQIHSNPFIYSTRVHNSAVPPYQTVICSGLQDSIRNTSTFGCQLKGLPSEIITPDDIRNEDVLFGRGKRAQNHPGNKYYRDVVSEIATQYKKCSKQQKTALSNSIVYTIHNHGGRFLTPLPEHANAWVEVVGLALRKKTSQALRDRTLNQKKNTEAHIKHVGRFRVFFRLRKL